MAFWNRKSDPKMVKDGEGLKTWKSTLKNEAAGFRSMMKSYANDPASENEIRTNAAAGNRWVAEEAERLYDGRGSHGSRSTQFDGHGGGKVPLFAKSGIWSWSKDPARWPFESTPSDGQSSFSKGWDEGSGFKLF